MNRLIAENICKTIKKSTILDNISLSLEGGKIYGIVGKNGSGKTMLIRALSGLMDIDSGEISYNGSILHKDLPVLPSLGITIENAGLYPEFTGLVNLKMLSKLKKLIGDDEIKQAIQRVGLDPNDKRTVRKYSLGMKQRIIIAQAIMERPDVIMVDEPTNGLDTDGTELIRTILKQEKERGAMILLASHSKDDIALLADEVFSISAGKLTYTDVSMKKE